MFNFSITRLKNKEKGKRCFILANGPSLAKENLSFLKNEIVIGMNASTLLESKFDFVQTYYVCSDVRFISHESKKTWCTDSLNEKTIAVFRQELKDYNIYRKNNYYVNAIKRDGFSKNIAYGFYFGSTTTMLALQLAYYIGCNEAYILGLDLNYESGQARFYEEEQEQEHDFFTSIQMYNIMNAAKIFSEEGKHIFLCSEKSLMRPYLHFVNFSSLFGVQNDN